MLPEIFIFSDVPRRFDSQLSKITFHFAFHFFLFISHSCIHSHYNSLLYARSIHSCIHSYPNPLLHATFTFVVDFLSLLRDLENVRNTIFLFFLLPSVFFFSPIPSLFFLLSFTLSLFSFLFLPPSFFFPFLFSSFSFLIFPHPPFSLFFSFYFFIFHNFSIFHFTETIVPQRKKTNLLR